MSASKLEKGSGSDVLANWHLTHVSVFVSEKAWEEAANWFEGWEIDFSDYKATWQLDIEGLG